MHDHSYARMAMIALALEALGCHSRQEAPRRGPSSLASPHTARMSASEADAIPVLVVAQMGPAAAISIDGVLNEPAWASAASTGEFVSDENVLRTRSLRNWRCSVSFSRLEV